MYWRGNPFQDETGRRRNFVKGSFDRVASYRFSCSGKGLELPIPGITRRNEAGAGYCRREKGSRKERGILAVTQNYPSLSVVRSLWEFF